MKEKFTSITEFINILSPKVSISGDSLSLHDDPFLKDSSDEIINTIHDAIYEFASEHPEYGTKNFVKVYEKVLQRYGITPEQWDKLTDAELILLNEKLLFVLVFMFAHAEFWQPGAFRAYCESGIVLKYLRRLREIDFQRTKKTIRKIAFTSGGFGPPPDTLTIDLKRSIGIRENNYGLRDLAIKRLEVEIPAKKIAQITKILAKLHLEYWAGDYDDFGVLDGEQWDAAIYYDDGSKIKMRGSNAYPENFGAFRKLFNVIK